MRIRFQYKESLYEDWETHEHPITPEQFERIKSCDMMELARFCLQEFIKQAGYFGTVEVTTDER